MTVITLEETARAEAFLAKVNSSARSYMTYELPRDVRGEWEGEAKTSVVPSKIIIQIILTHTCGGQVTGTSEFPHDRSNIHELGRGRKLGASLVRDIRAHKCDVPHLKIVEPRSCSICGVTDSKYPEWEGECNHATRRILNDSAKIKRKSGGARSRIGGRKGPAKARRRVVEKSRCGVELP